MAIKDCNGLEIPHIKAAISFSYFPCRYMVRRDADPTPFSAFARMMLAAGSEQQRLDETFQQPV